MTIYRVDANGDYYFVESQDTVDSNKHLKCFVGGAQEAKIFYDLKEQQFLDTYSHIFSINKETEIEGNTIWAVVLDIELENSNDVFNVFDPINGVYEKVVGSDMARKTLENIKQNLLKNNFFFGVTEVDSLPPPDKFFSSGIIPVEIM